jgi:hypothetical protein
MMCGTRLSVITFDLAQLMFQQARDCLNGYGAMNGFAETHRQFCPHHAAAIRYDTADGRRAP